MQPITAPKTAAKKTPKEEPKIPNAEALPARCVTPQMTYRINLST